MQLRCHQGRTRIKPSLIDIEHLKYTMYENERK